MMFDEILEYPYNGTITHVVQGTGMEEDSEVVLYEGEMDLHTNTPEEGRTMQTADYIVSIPLKQDAEGKWIVPRKGDKITVERYGETINLTVDNAEPSQLGGVSINAARKSW